MPLWHKGCPLQLVGCATSSLGIRTSASWADDNRKGTCCSPLLRPGQGCNCRTRTAQWKAERLCSGSCMEWVERSDIKHVPQMKTSWTFHHFYTSSKPHQVAHFWFHGSATCHSTSVFYFFLPWLQVENTWVNWLPLITMTIKAFDSILNDSISPPQMKPSLNPGNVQSQPTMNNW